MYWVYVLVSHVTGRRYTGSCADIDERLRRHNAGHSLATRHGVPWVVVYRESFPTRAEAARRERYLKTGQDRRWLDEQLGERGRLGRQVGGSNPPTSILPTGK